MTAPQSRRTIEEITNTLPPYARDNCAILVCRCDQTVFADDEHGVIRFHRGPELRPDGKPFCCGGWDYGFCASTRAGEEQTR